MDGFKTRILALYEAIMADPTVKSVANVDFLALVDEAEKSFESYKATNTALTDANNDLRTTNTFLYSRIPAGDLSPEQDVNEDETEFDPDDEFADRRWVEKHMEEVTI